MSTLEALFVVFYEWKFFGAESQKNINVGCKKFDLSNLKQQHLSHFQLLVESAMPVSTGLRQTKGSIGSSG